MQRTAAIFQIYQEPFRNSSEGRTFPSYVPSGSKVGLRLVGFSRRQFNSHPRGCCYEKLEVMIKKTYYYYYYTTVHLHLYLRTPCCPTYMRERDKQRIFTGY